jgi:hypothetical protein
MNEFKVLIGAISSVPSGIMKMFETPLWSTICVGITTCLSFVFGHEYAAYAFAGLLVIDGITGWMKARKNGSKPDSSTLGEKTLAKLLVYLTPLLGWTFMEVMLESSGAIAPGTFYPVRVVIIGWIGAREMLSILENLNTIVGGEYPFIRNLYNKVKGIEEQFSNNLNKNGDKK